MSTVLASTSQADSATTTTSSWSWGSDVLVTATMTNGASPPSQFGRVQLQASTDNVNWTVLDDRSALAGPSEATIQIFALAQFSGNTNQNTGGGFNATTPWLYYRLYFYGNVGAAITVAATDSRGRLLVAVPLVGTTATTGGAVASWTPPQGGTGIVVERAIVNVTTKSTGSANLSVGVAANATTSATNLIPATAVGSAAVVLDSITTQIIAATAAESGIQDLAIAMASAGAVTVTGSASTVGIVGTLYIEALLPP